MHLQVLLRTMHVQVCTLDRCCVHQRTHLRPLPVCSSLVLQEEPTERSGPSRCPVVVFSLLFFLNIPFL